MYVIRDGVINFIQTRPRYESYALKVAWVAQNPFCNMSNFINRHMSRRTFLARGCHIADSSLEIVFLDHLLLVETISRSGRGFKLTLDLGDIGERRQARLIAEMLDFVGGCRSRKVEMVLPSQRGIGHVGIDIGAVENISGSAGIENAIRWYGQCGKRPYRRTRPSLALRVSPRQPGNLGF